ncbi:hydroxymethylpyrimidine/phosphomethylpyrimidine kinase [Bizionia argentinensis JUB59]|uniref:hydroxymethylpyrimidine kinase n=1 Tax=Bizionia argentinensis JUB59 TaxID=1046627 RepID=G2EB28_9FLAO|nr:hydroxymethylpyrimidine/phosphomethylpyrimidine kinase [Bizionia argentinensis]EGV44370.1 hydroxymethylpyrimidine/phosphomethylpyrimidine kinase [Bizionia argentinensis JUB59]
MSNHNYLLSIAGLDPSSGAGLTADIKTFEAHGFYGLSVCTAITIQNDIDFKESHWVDTAIIIKQIETLFERFEIHVVKIGVIENWTVLATIVEKLHELNASIKIIVDPVLSASSGFVFHSEMDLNVLDSLMDKIYILTPNYEEIQRLYPALNIEETIAHISGKTNIYLKGGHRTDKKGWDELYHSQIVMVNLPPGVIEISEKHGSGCVLSSALAANIALNLELEEACINAKNYTEHFLNSNLSLLGNHNYNRIQQSVK